MQTIELERLRIKPGQLVLDAGCGTGRHLMAAMGCPGVYVVGVDLNWEDLCRSRDSLVGYGNPGGLDKSAVAGIDDAGKPCAVIKASVTNLPFQDESFDAVICSEVLEHIRENHEAVRELVRVLKPKGTLAISVPRYLPERICWAISRAYHQEPGGHIRIYRKGELQTLFTSSGLSCLKVNYKHALHAPYWWLKCVVGHKNNTSRLVSLYRRLLEWDIMKRPVVTTLIERLLNPLIGKSMVFYLKKGRRPRKKSGCCVALHPSSLRRT
ncbi:MAG: class I SAM-dependent methyltransferase [Smithellaceae bacterium]|nr:class I SAM-dependent methyltransferase [Smithellaceae bacterium]